MLDDPEAFETAVHKLVSKLGTSHTGFFHQSVRRVPGRLSIGANFRRAETEAGPSWIVQDVHTGGPGSKAGLRRFDVLVAVNGKAVTPPETPTLPMGAEVSLQLRRDLQELTLTISIPALRSRKQPSAEIDPVVTKRLAEDTGYLKVAVLPGLLGLDVARSIDKAFEELASCQKLVLDLRGHLAADWGFSD